MNIYVCVCGAYNERKEAISTDYLLCHKCNKYFRIRGTIYVFPSKTEIETAQQTGRWQNGGE